MTVTTFPAPILPLPLQSAAQRLWKIRHLMQEGVVDLRAADTALRPFRDHPNARVSALAQQTVEEASRRFASLQRLPASPRSASGALEEFMK